MQQKNTCNYSDGSQLWAPRSVKATGKEVSEQLRRRGLMTDPGKDPWETRNPDAALRNSVQTLRFASANVGTLSGKSAEVADMLHRRRVDVAGLQEVRYRNSGAKMVKGGGERYKLFWSGGPTPQGGVGVMVHADLVKNVVEVRRVHARIIVVVVVIQDELVSILSVYAPQCGCSAEAKDSFYDDLSMEMLKVQERCVLLGDFNGHVGKHSAGYEGVHRGFGYGRRNAEGERLLEFADSFGLKIMNTWFKKEIEKLVTYESGEHSTMIDYILVGKKGRVKDVKAIPGEEVMRQHRIILLLLRYWL